MTPTEKVTDLLAEAGYVVTRLKVARGYWSHRQQDVCRWDGTAIREFDGYPIIFHSWDTVTDCARRGFTIAPAEFGPLSIEISAKPRRSCRAAKEACGDA